MRTNRIIIGSVFAIVAVSLAAGVYQVSQRQGVFDVRNRAATVRSSSVLLDAPQTVSVGEEFSVEVLLDTQSDTKYSIGSVESGVSFSSSTHDVQDTNNSAVRLTSVEFSGIFDEAAYVNTGDARAGTVVLSARMESGSLPIQGFRGRGVLAQLRFVAVRSGTLTVLLEPDSSVTGVAMAGDESILQPVERLFELLRPVQVTIIDPDGVL